jgi:hypothetical protein
MFFSLDPRTRGRKKEPFKKSRLDYPPQAGFVPLKERASTKIALTKNKLSFLTFHYIKSPFFPL